MKKKTLLILGTGLLLTFSTTLTDKNITAQEITWKGDLRTRYQNQNTTNDGNAPRARVRIRTRLGMTADVNDNITVYGGLATGSNDPRSTNQTLTNSFETKSIQLDGIITEQMVQKNFETKAFGGGSKDNQRDGKLTADTDFSHGRASGTAPTNSTGYVSVKMTPHEIAQLIHSHVDSSIIQPHQNLNELVFLIPSFVNYDYHYQGSCSISAHTSKRSCEENDGTWTPIAASAGAVTALEPADGKLVPFNWGVRHYGVGGNELDNKYTIINTSKYPKPYVTDGDVSGVKGFVRSFNTSFSEQPYITFSMTFEVAITGL